MKRNVLTITYFVDPKHKRHVEIPVNRVGTMLIGGLVLVGWSVVSAVKILIPTPARGLRPANAVEASPSPPPTAAQTEVIKAAALNATVITPEDASAAAAGLVDSAAESNSEEQASDSLNAGDESLASGQVEAKNPDPNEEKPQQSAMLGLAPKAENAEPIVLDPLAPSTLPAEASEPGADPAAAPKNSKASASGVSVRFGEVRLIRDKTELRAEIPLINARSDGQTVAGLISGEATYIAKDGEPHTIQARRQLKFSARHQTTKTLLFPNPPQGGRFKRVELRVRDSASGAATTVEKPIP